MEGCRILCTPFLTIQKLKLGHEKLMTFLRSFENLYGSIAVTPNMHLHTHLVECIIDYEPMHSVWLYSFERMNGVLGSVNTNQRSVEIQLMRKMSQCQAIAIFERPELYSDIFVRVFEYETDKTIKNYKAVEVQRVLGLSANQVSDNKA